MESNINLNSQIYVVIDPSFTSDKAIEEDVCTFKYTKDRYSFQKWFHCQNCNVYCCIICKNKCHKDHQLNEESESDFFCDCGAENKLCIALG